MAKGKKEPAGTLQRVTITGADDSIAPDDLVKIAESYPFVEWGILFSEKHAGTARFPSRKWVAELQDWARATTLQLSLHLCGDTLRAVTRAGGQEVIKRQLLMSHKDARIQLNFHGQVVEALEFDQLQSFAMGRQVIFQCDGVNNQLAYHAIEHGLNAVPFYDSSHGTGALPAEWPAARPGIFTGYAGGLNPDNLEEQLIRIQKAAAGIPHWVDMESGVRTKDGGGMFDAQKVIACLEIAKPKICTIIKV